MLDNASGESYDDYPQKSTAVILISKKRLLYRFFAPLLNIIISINPFAIHQFINIQLLQFHHKIKIQCLMLLGRNIAQLKIFHIAWMNLE